MSVKINKRKRLNKKKIFDLVNQIFYFYLKSLSHHLAHFSKAIQPETQNQHTHKHLYHILKFVKMEKLKEKQALKRGFLCWRGKRSKSRKARLDQYILHIIWSHSKSKLELFATGTFKVSCLQRQDGGC